MLICTPKPTSVILQLVDRSLTYRTGIVDDVLVKVKDFLLPADFIILDTEEDRDVPLILGRPFRETAKTQIDVEQGKVTMKVQVQEITINVTHL